VLPVATYLEMNGIVTPGDSYPIIGACQKAIRIIDCHSDYEIFSDLARRLDARQYFWEDDAKCAEDLLKPAGVSFSELKHLGSIGGMRAYRDYETSGFKTPSGKVELYSGYLAQNGFDPLPVYRELPETPYSDPELAKEYPLIFTSWKVAPFRHTEGRQIASLRGSHPEPLVHINRQTASKLGISDGDWVYIETKRGRIRQKAQLTNDFDPRVVGLDWGWWFPENGASDLYGWSQSNINILTDNKPPHGREMGSSNLRGMLCKVYKA